MRSFAVFAVAGALALLAANHRFGDSAHAIGLINRNGGKAVHPFMLASDHDTYTVIATATVQPSYRGDARVIVEGLPPTDYTVMSAEPIIRLGWHHRPGFSQGVLNDLESGDRLSLWVRLAANRVAQAEHRPLALTFFDVKTGATVLHIPFVFEGDGVHERH